MATKNVESLLLVGNGNGIVIIPSKSPLTRLNYFDGKFLRASDLKDEQNYLRQLVRLSNQAGGSGAVHGFDLTLGGGDTLNLGPGLGIDPDGRVLLLPQEVSMGIQELIDLSLKAQASSKASKEGTGVFGDCVMVSDLPPINQVFPGDLYLIVLFPAEALCGEEDVYGKLCEEACATSTDRPFAVEGLIVRAVPLVLKTPLPQSKIIPITSKLYLRSRVASAYFEDERKQVASMISKFGLAQEVWCLGAEAATGNGLPIGVIARAGTTTVFLDAWIARRERMDTPPRRYWQWRMMMRPWDVFMAQVLQFQCQLRDLFDGEFTPAPEDPCGDAKSVLGETAKKLADFLQAHKALSSDTAFQADLLQLESMSQKLTETEKDMKVVPVGNRLLIQGGIIEMSSAGYLPVLPNANISVNEQVSKMLGEGVDLRFCVVRPDFVAHALEEAQHMERISLIQGLDDPKLKPEVDILVPDGEIEESQVGLKALEASVKFLPDFSGDFIFDFAEGEIQNFQTVANLTLAFDGAARHEATQSGAHKFYASMLFDDSFLANLLKTFATFFILDSELKITPAATSASAEETKNEDAEADVRDKKILSRFKTAFAAKRKARARAEAPTASRLPTASAEISASAAADVAAVSGAGTIVPGGLWLEMNCDRDPTKLQKNDVLHVTGRAVIGALLPAPLSIPAYLDIHLNLDLFVDQASTTGGSNFLLGSVSVFGSVIAKFKNKESDSRVVNLKVEAKWTNLGAGLGTQIDGKVTDPDSGGHLTFSAKVGGPSAEIGGVIGSGGDSYFEFKFKPNAQVLSAGNQSHQNALAAINAIGTALNNPAFVATASAQLFPAVPNTSGLTIRATRDWVLFHRRRRKNCGTIAVAAPARKYRVYQLAFIPDGTQNPDPKSVIPNHPPTVQELLAVTAKQLEPFKPIGVVTFSGGVATLLDSSAVQSAWQKIPGGKIFWGGIGSSGDAVNDGETLARSRLQTLESILDQVDPSARADVLPIVPPPLASADVDGIIVLINAAPVVENADLRIEKTADLGQIVGGGRTVIFNLQVVNDGPTAAKDVTVTDPTPAGTTLSGTPVVPVGWTVSGPGPGGAGNVVFTKPLMAPGETANFQFTVLIGPNLPAGTITNTATVTSATPDNNPGNNKADTITSLTGGRVGVERVALLVFQSPDGKLAQNSPTPPAKVVFQNNAPQGSALKDTVAKIQKEQQVIQVRIAALGGPIDSTPAAQQRQSQVLEALKNGAVEVSTSVQKPIGSLPDSEKPALGLTNAQQLVGVNEVIVLGVTAFKP